MLGGGGRGIDFEVWNADGTTRPLFPDNVLGVIYVSKVGGVEKSVIHVRFDPEKYNRVAPENNWELHFSKTQWIFIRHYLYEEGGIEASEYYGADKTLPENSTIEIYWWLA